MKALRPHTHAFSFIELLVLLGVIAALAALLLPVAARARRQSAMVGDAGQLRQLWVVASQFSQEHQNLVLVGTDKRDRYGYGLNTEWFRVLRPYLGSTMNGKETIPLYISPGDPSRGGEELLGPTRAFKFRSYGVNLRTEYRSTLRGEDGSLIHSASEPLNRLSVRRPDLLVLLCNVDVGTVGDTSGVNSLSSSYQKGTVVPRDWFGNGRANLVFLDGHIEAVRVDDILPDGPRFSLFDRDTPVE